MREIAAQNPDFSTKSQINRAVSRALKLALASAPLYPELKRQIAKTGENERVFAVDFFFHDDQTVRELNQTHRAKDKPTDVLSFPLFEGEVFAFPTAPDEPIALGDMVISVETAARQALELGHDLADEIAFLSIHGALHLLGYDHDNDRARRQMFALQDRIFEAFQTEVLARTLRAGTVKKQTETAPSNA